MVTDPDRMAWDTETFVGTNGAWMDFDQDEPPYYPGEQGNDPFARSKYALSHIWREWPGMADVVTEMKAQEAASGVYPKGAGPHAAAEYAAKVIANPTTMSGEVVPTTAQEARDYWTKWEAEHAGAEVTSQVSKL